MNELPSSSCRLEAPCSSKFGRSESAGGIYLGGPLFLFRCFCNCKQPHRDRDTHTKRPCAARIYLPFVFAADTHKIRPLHPPAVPPFSSWCPSPPSPPCAVVVCVLFTFIVTFFFVFSLSPSPGVVSLGIFALRVCEFVFLHLILPPTRRPFLVNNKSAGRSSSQQQQLQPHYSPQIAPARPVSLRITT